MKDDIECDEGWDPDPDNNQTCWERVPDGALVRMKFNV